MKIALWLLLSTLPLAAQSTANKAQPPARAAKIDDWQKRQECSHLAEKVVGEFRSRSIANGGHGESDWKNHYSPKYNRCYVVIYYLTHTKDGGGKDFPMFTTTLLDAQERSTVAASASAPGPTDGWCAIEEKDEKVGCFQVDLYISEHMKN